MYKFQDPLFLNEDNHRYLFQTVDGHDDIVMLNMQQSTEDWMEGNFTEWDLFQRWHAEVYRLGFTCMDQAQYYADITYDFLAYKDPTMDVEKILRNHDDFGEAMRNQPYYRNGTTDYKAQQEWARDRLFPIGKPPSNEDYRLLHVKSHKWRVLMQFERGGEFTQDFEDFEGTEEQAKVFATLLSQFRYGARPGDCKLKGPEFKREWNPNRNYGVVAHSRGFTVEDPSLDYFVAYIFMK